MTRAEVKAVLSRVSYKPGWTWELTDRIWDAAIFPAKPYGISTLTIWADVPDAVGGNPHFKLQHSSGITSEMLDSEEAVLHWLFEVLLRMEMHEMDEWLKLDGACVHDPHPEAKK